ncbi:MAG: alpha/beta fold hydrolase [Dehalococcoidia bacterium]
MSQLSFETAGDSANPSVMLVHGLLSSNAQWLMNRDALAAEYQLVMVELWGHGKSPAPSDADAYSVAAYVEQFERIREELGIEQWALIGQSYGAGLTIRYALARPARCTAVVVTNSRSAFGDLTGGRRRGDGAARPTLSSSRDLPIHPINARRFPAAVKEALVADADAVPLEAIWNGGRLTRDLRSTELLGDLSVPLLVANGVFEKPFQTEVAKLRALYPALEVVDLEGGHSVNIEDAAGFNATVLEFLNRQA